MATYTVYGTDYTGPMEPNGILMPSSNDILVTQPGDTYVIHSSVDDGFNFGNGHGADPIDVNVVFNESNAAMTNQETMSFGQNLNPAITVADGADMGTLNISAPWSVQDMERFSVSIGEDASIGSLAIGGSGSSDDLQQFDITLADGSSIGTGAGDAIAAGGSNIDITVIGGMGVDVLGDIAMGGTNNLQTITFGDDAHIAGNMSIGGANNTNSFTFGDRAIVDEFIVGSTSGTETWEFGSDWLLANVNLQGGDDTLILGPTTVDGTGTITGGSGADTLIVNVRDEDRVEFAQAAEDAGWTENPDGSYTTNNRAMTWRGTSYQSFSHSEYYVCFTPGTMIATPRGEVPVERLTVGDTVQTDTCGAQPIRWIGRRQVDLPATAERMRPIRFAPGSLGPNQPSHPLAVSPCHALVLAGGSGPPVLAPAKAFLRERGVRRMNGLRSVVYISIMLPAHHVIRANGVPVETFYPGPWALSVLTPIDRARLQARFPGVADDPTYAFGPRVHPLLRIRAAQTRLSTRDRVGAIRKFG